MTGRTKLAKKAIRHKVIATRLAADGLPLPVPLDAVVRGHRPMPLALDTGNAWRTWGATHGYTNDQIKMLMSALPSLVASTSYLIEVRRAGSRRWYADGNPAGQVSDEHRRVAAVALADRKARRETEMAAKAASGAQERVPVPSGVIDRPEPSSAKPVAVPEEMTTPEQAMLGMDMAKPHRCNPVIEVRRSVKIHPGPLSRKGFAARPDASALEPPPPVPPAPTPFVLAGLFQTVATRRHTLKLASVWSRLPDGAALIDAERAAVLADVWAELERQGLGCPPLTEAAIREKLGDLLLLVRRTD